MPRCARKQRYATEDEAAVALAHITVRGMQGDRYSGKRKWWGHQPIAVYECDLCLGWHLTSNPQHSEIRRRLGK